jgi:Flp pilus assembly pilin Flp
MPLPIRPGTLDRCWFMTKFIDASRRFKQSETGASLAEYGVLFMLILIGCLAGMAYFGSSISGFFNFVGNTL